MFRDLAEAEVKEFQQWARDNYAPHSKVNEVWHPVVRAECEKINAEEDQKVRDALERKEDN